MKDQHEALRLANSMHLAYRVGWQREAAAELRRLYDLADKYKWQVIDTCARAEKAEAQRDALLQALKDVVAFTGAHGGPYAQARAAIKAGEGEKS